ncbi:hypothetical protein BHM03_00051673, partial [Ensete ventricosum]
RLVGAAQLGELLGVADLPPLHSLVLIMLRVSRSYLSVSMPKNPDSSSKQSHLFGHFPKA